MTKTTDGPQIQLLVQKIREKFEPQGSDIDLLIVMNTNLKPYKQASLIRLFLDETFGVTYPIDIIVRTPESIERRIKEGDFFIKSVLEEGASL
ncbi:hypothetical protein AUJ66_07395 [Candidatus Desantisbacteria bacterium CG1_02_38_46]|uniref:Polymerase nucleotidyl transferase domain-containing protein n=2 Tax=unclassified Candidatus Desantisiibacteriota TaxID=3106372 RepID=A0A1J4S9I8_9BACT|nr:MAG: hypothetical protein AUJ66_07395 [Candidatus Desantisbacteria bacterium CG1_02_38_46]PIU51259.1 MAG: hypothetical protein COS91_05415 [Candidatus Desantisbacteria bacterium CG07_land_8_20_14_0_80_39_15]